MSDKTNKYTKAEVYAQIKAIVEGKAEVATLGDEMVKAIVERMDKDIESATKKSTSKKPTANDKLNGDIQTAILEVVADGDVVYSEFVKAVQGKFADVELSAQKITANVTKLKNAGKVATEEKGKGKEKKLYIKPVPVTE